MWKPSAPNQPLKPRRVDSILRGTGPAGALAAEARILVRVERVVHRILGEESVSHVRAAGLSPNSLTLLADSPAWASVARFRAPDICADVRSEIPRIRHARVAIMETETPMERRPAAERRSISPSTARVLRSVARSIDNPRLARILIRLAARGHPPAGRVSASASSSFGFSRP